MPYTLTMQDVDAFLASKGDDEVIGITCHSSKCLLANVIRMKDPEAKQIEVGGGQFVVDGETVKLSPDLIVLYHEFDALEDHPIYERLVTKREWMYLTRGIN